LGSSAYRLVQEILSPLIKDVKKKPVQALQAYLGNVYGEKTFKMFVSFVIVFIHVLVWFLLAGLVMSL
jgi:hypothetical protein